MRPITRDGVPAGVERARMAARYAATRNETEALAAPLSAEDQTVQSMPDCSPTKWHRAHTTWFFETFVLARVCAGLSRLSTRLTAISSIPITRRWGRAIRGPSAACCRGRASPRSRAIAAMSTRRWPSSSPGWRERPWREAAPLLELGLQHEQQHQELILMDIKHALSLNPLQPAYRAGRRRRAGARRRRSTWHAVRRRPAADRPWRRRLRLRQREAAPQGVARPVSPAPAASSPAASISTSSPTRAIAAPEFWLSDGWAMVQQQGW